MDDLHVVTLSPEEDESFPELGVSYLYADLRELPFKDGVLRPGRLDLDARPPRARQRRASAADAPVAEDPQPEAVRAVYELRRVLRPGGDLYLTLPVGSGDRFDWVRSFTADEVDELVEAFEPARSTVRLLPPRRRHGLAPRGARRDRRCPLPRPPVERTGRPGPRGGRGGGRLPAPGAARLTSVRCAWHAPSTPRPSWLPAESVTPGPKRACGHHERRQRCKLFGRQATANTVGRLEALPRGGDLRLLDVGCADGEWTARVAQAIGTRHVCGIEVADAAGRQPSREASTCGRATSSSRGRFTMPPLK